MKVFDLNGLPDDQYAPPILEDLGSHGPIETALANAKFGTAGTWGHFLQSVFCGHPDPKGLEKGITEFVWRGKIWDKATKSDKPGMYFAVSPYPAGYLERAGSYGIGLCDPNVGTPCVLCVEVDENPDGSPVSLVEQCRRLDALVALGLPSPNAVCLSGGKSVHAFWSVTGMTLAVRQELETALLALTGADPSVGTPGHKMRLGGYKDDKRTQTILTLHQTPSTTDAMRSGLDACSVAWGQTGNPVVVLAARNAARADRHGSTVSSGRKTATGKVVATWDPSATEVTLLDGGKLFASALPVGKHPCYCPFGNHSKSPDKAVVFVDRRVTLHCLPCNTTWVQDAPRVFTKTTDTANSKTRTISARWLPQFGGIDPGVLAVRSPRGTGKTTVIVDAIAAELIDHPERRAIVITHRRALVAKYLNDLSGLGFVGMPESGPIAGDRVVVCLDSLPRVPVYDATPGSALAEMPMLGWHVAFVDEIEQVIGHLDAESLRKNQPPEKVVWSLQAILTNTRSVVLADADLGQLTHEFCEQLGLPPPESLVNEFKMDRSARLYGLQTAVESRLWADWADGKRVAVACTTRSDATRIAKRLAECGGWRSVVCVTADTSAQYADLIAQPDAWLAENKPDALVYSPSLGTGVDISIRDYWDTVFVVADVGKWADVFSILQAAERVRNPKEEVRHIWIRDAKLFGVTDLEALRRDFIRPVINDLVTAQRWGGVTGPAVYRSTICDVTREIIIRARAARARAQGNILADATHLMVDLGWSLSWEAKDEDERARKQIRAEKKAIKDAWIVMIADAVPMELAEAKAVLRSSASMPERAKALSAVLRDSLGVRQLDRDMVRAWLFGGLSSQIRVFGLWRLLTPANREHLAASIAWQLARLSNTSVQPSAYLSQVEKFANAMALHGVPAGIELSADLGPYKVNTVNESVSILYGPDADRDPKGDGETLLAGGIKRTNKRDRVAPGKDTKANRAYAVDQSRWRAWSR